MSKLAAEQHAKVTPSYRPHYSVITGFRNFEHSLPANLPPPEPTVSAGVRVEDAKSHQCCWPIGVDEDGRWRFCGSQRGIEPGLAQAYCLDHAARVNAGRAYFAPAKQPKRERRAEIRTQAAEFLAWRESRTPELFLEAA